MSGTITRGSFPADLKPIVKLWFDDILSQPKYMWRDIFKIESTGDAFERVMSQSNFGLFHEKEEVGSVYWDDAQQGFATDYTVMDYALGFQISKNAINDGTSNRLLKSLTKALGRSAGETPEVLAFDIFNNAFAAGTTYGDGQPLCSTSHPAAGAGGGTSQNRPTVDASLSETAIEDGRIIIKRYKNGKGIVKNIQTDCLLVTPEEEANAYRIVNSMLRPYTANNDPNFIKDVGMFPKGLKVSPYLDDTDAWFMLNDIDDGLTCFNRQDLEFGESVEQSTFVHSFLASFRLIFGCSNWEAVYGSPGM